MTDKVNILLVDDRPEKLLALEAVLEDLGQNIVRAYNGREALRHILAHDFAVILLDVNMPGMDGFETAELIRQRKNSEHIPIIFITAFGDEMHVRRGYSLGAVDYILTPVVPAVLRSKVSVFVDLFKKTEQTKRQAEWLRRRAAQLQKLAAASMSINRAMPLDRMLRTVTDSTRDVIGAHQAITLFLADPYSGRRTGSTQAVGSFSDKYADWRDRPLRLDEVAGTLVAQSRHATRLSIDELHGHPDWEIVRTLDIPPIAGGILAAPFTGRDGNNLGILYLTDRNDGEAFTDDDEAVLVQLAQMASIAIENTIFAEEREANRIKDEFLSTLSHELRTPLNAIMGWTQLLQMENTKAHGAAVGSENGNGEDSAHGLEVIERNVRAQTKLIEDLLDVSRITTGKLRVALRPIELDAVLRSAVDTIRPAADAKRVAVNVERLATDQSLTVSADPDRLQQVVWNLLSNAVKFTPEGGRVDVALRRLPHCAEIVVSDTGQGIDPQFLPYVFDRFRQADSTSTRSHGGLGIGLTIARHIVELHGGAVRADSAGLGRGATFTITLPIATLSVGVDPSTVDVPTGVTSPAKDLSASSTSGMVRGAKPSAAASSGASSSSPNLEGRTILVVDDEADAREVIARLLERFKARVHVAATARAAFDRITAAGPDRPDLLISDIAMPEEDGYALIRRIRRLPPADGGAVPAIALTAYAREEDRLRALRAGFQRHLPKPVSPGDLGAAVAELLASKHSLPPTPIRPEVVQT